MLLSVFLQRYLVCKRLSPKTRDAQAGNLQTVLDIMRDLEVEDLTLREVKWCVQYIALNYPVSHREILEDARKAFWSFLRKGLNRKIRSARKQYSHICQRRT